MAEHITRNDGVVGSIPTASSKTRRNCKIPAGFYNFFELNILKAQEYMRYEQVSVPKEVAEFLEENRKRAQAQARQDKRHLSRSEFETVLPPIRFVISQLLPHGLHVLAGAPKVGKSWLSLVA